MAYDIIMTILTGVFAFGLMRVHQRIDKVSTLTGFQYLTALLCFLPLVVVIAWVVMVSSITELPGLSFTLVALSISTIASVISIVLLWFLHVKRGSGKSVLRSYSTGHSNSL